MLTKEILCAYAPFGVKVYLTEREDITPMLRVNLSSALTNTTSVDTVFGEYGTSYFKLCLRPLSSIDLKWFQDNIDPDLEDFRINCEPESNHFSVEVCEKVLGWSALSYEEYQLFLKNHVDIFGLLESGHAIELKEVDNG